MDLGISTDNGKQIANYLGLMGGSDLDATLLKVSHGTINDLAMRGAMPTCLSLGMILEEGLLISDLERIADSIKEAAEIAQVPIVAGDTKVVPRGKADKIFINTSGIGQLEDGVDISANQASPGDLIILTGSMANHGMTILTSRAGLQVTGNLQSDTRALHFLIQALIQRLPGSIHTLRDPTRGGVGTTLWEIANSAKATMEIDESLIPIRPEVRAACELMGLDPLYLANEGTCLIIIAADQANTALNIIRQRPEGKEAAIIGVVAEEQHNRVVLQTISGGARIVEPLTGEPLPRIC